MFIDHQGCKTNSEELLGQVYSRRLQTTQADEMWIKRICLILAGSGKDLNTGHQKKNVKVQKVNVGNRRYKHQDTSKEINQKRKNVKKRSQVEHKRDR